MFYLIKESFPLYDCSNMCGYQFENQEILYSLSLLITSIYDQHAM
jgi:hypothetical protein